MQRKGEKPPMVIKPRGNRLLLRRILSDAETPGGIVLPDMAREKRQFGEVLEIGDGELLGDFKLGQIVVFALYGGVEVEADEGEFVILDEQDVLATCEEEGAVADA